MTRMTHNTLLVLRALMAAPDREMYGLEIMRASSLPSGTVYPLLDRLEAAGWAQSRTEDIAPKDEGRPRRKYYRITPAGEAAAREEMEREAARLAALGVTAAAAAAPLTVGGIEIPVVVDDRQPPCIVSVIAPGGEETEVRSFALAPEEETEPCKHEGLKLSKGVCPDCEEWVVKPQRTR